MLPLLMLALRAGLTPSSLRFSSCLDLTRGGALVALTPDEISLIDRMKRNLEASWVDDEKHLRYYLGQQRLEQIGLTIPPALRRFTVVANWPRVVADTIERRQNVRSLILPGEEKADPQLRAIWDANNLDSDLSMFNLDRLIYGRAFMSVGANEDDPSLPLMHVESPRELTALIDTRKRSMVAACRFYGVDADTGNGPTHVTLYLPNKTVWIERGVDGRYGEVDRDEHNLGVVPIVMHLNRRLSGSWRGESELTDIIPITDACARSLTDMQFAQASHGAPRMFMTGVAMGDFTDAAGEPIPKIEAYFNAVTTVTDPQAKVGQLEAADLKNFETAVNLYGRQASTLTGMPARYFGQQTSNPPTEGSIRADENQLVESVERQNTAVGTTLGWASALSHRFATGEWVQGNRIRVDWHDPATPTVAQRTDALVKMRQVNALSREGMWDELGWSEARKAKERAYFDAEALDPVTRALVDGVTRDAAIGD
jgi:hypothetical protein